MNFIIVFQGYQLILDKVFMIFIILLLKVHSLFLH